MSYANDIVTPVFVKRWAEGLERSKTKIQALVTEVIESERSLTLAYAFELSDRRAIELAADIVREVIGDGFINDDTLKKAVVLASPDPLSDPRPRKPAA